MSEAKFHQDLVSHFPNIYDIKIIADHAIHTGFRGSLQYLAEKLGVSRDDNCEHQAGSDSKITAKCFFELKKADPKALQIFNGEVYGLSRSESNSHHHHNTSYIPDQRTHHQKNHKHDQKDSLGFSTGNVPVDYLDEGDELDDPDHYEEVDELGD